MAHSSHPYVTAITEPYVGNTDTEDHLATHPASYRILMGASIGTVATTKPTHVATTKPTHSKHY
jgi:hypothetical protein